MVPPAEPPAGSPDGLITRVPVTYAKLLAAVKDKGQDVANRQSALRRWMRTHRRAESDDVGPELGSQFFEALVAHKAALQADGARPDAVDSAASRVRAVWRLVPDLERRAVGGDTFAAALDAACRASGLTNVALAEGASMDKAVLWGWRTMGQTPSSASRESVAALELVLHVPPGSLARLIPRVYLPADLPLFARLLREDLAAAQLTVHAAARSAGVPFKRLYNWTIGHLPRPEHRARDLPRLEAALGLDAGTLASRLPTGTQSTDLRYRVALTAAQQAEYARFVAYKTNPMEYRRDRRPAAFWRVRSWDGRCPTAGIYEGVLKSLYGYRALPPDHANALLRGPGLRAEDGSLLDFADPGVVMGYVHWLAARTRADHTFRTQAAAADPAAARRAGSMPSGYNENTRVVLEFALALLRPTTGYLWQAHEYGAEVARAFPSLAPDGVVTDAALDAWRARVEGAHRELREHAEDLKAITAPSRGHDRIARILAMPRPMAALAVLCERARLDWEQTQRHSRSPERLATRLRDYLLVALLSVAPLRLGHWAQMTWRPDGTGNLRRVRDPLSPHHGHYELHFPMDSFKALAGTRKMDYVAEVPKALTPYLDLYLREYRSLLVGADRCDYVFRPRRLPRKVRPNAAAAPAGVDKFVAAVTRRLIPDYAPRGFLTHAFRHIIATHFVRNYPVDGMVRAANALHNTMRSIQQHYGHITALDQTRRALDSIQAEYTRIAEARAGGEGGVVGAAPAAPAAG